MKISTQFFQISPLTQFCLVALPWYRDIGHFQFQRNGDILSLSALGSCRTCSCINPPAFNDWWSLRYTKGTTKSEHKNCVPREDIGTHNSVTDYETHSNCVATEDNETQADKEPQDDTGALQVVLMLPRHLTRRYAKGTSKGTTIGTVQLRLQPMVQ